MGNTHQKHGSSMDLGRLRARLASPLTEVKSTESGKVDVVNIEVTGKVVKMLCAPYKDPQDPLNVLEALDTHMIFLNANLADGADPVSPVVMAKLIDNPGTMLVIYGKVEPFWDALQTVLETPGIAKNDYWYEKVQVCYWLPGAGKTGTGGIQVEALVLLAGVKIKKKVCTTLLDCEASHCLCHLATPHYRSVGPAPAIVRALSPIPDFSTLFPVTPIFLDLTSDSMLYKTQNPKFPQVPLVTQSKQISEVHPWQPMQ